MLPPDMRSEFNKLFVEYRNAGEGTIAAKRLTLGVMLQLRRSDLGQHLAAMPSYSCDAKEVTHTITRLTAELTMLMIERGA